MSRLLVQQIAEEKGYTLTTLHLALNRDPNQSDGVAMGTVRRYWYSDLERVDLSMLARIARVLGVRPLELINEAALGETKAAA